MTGSVARRPDDLESSITQRNHVSVCKVFVGLRQRIVHPCTHPRRPHPFYRIFIDWKAVSHEEFARFGSRRGWSEGQHSVDSLHLERVQQSRRLAALLDCSGGPEMVDMMMRPYHQVQVLYLDPDLS